MSNITELPGAAPAPVSNPKRRGVKARRIAWMARQGRRQQKPEKPAPRRTTEMDKVLPALRLAQRLLTGLRVCPTDLTEPECAIIEESFLAGIAAVMDSRKPTAG